MIRRLNLPTIKATNILVHIPTETVYHCSKPGLELARSSVDWFAIKREKELVHLDFVDAARAIEQGIVTCGESLKPKQNTARALQFQIKTRTQLKWRLDIVICLARKGDRNDALIPLGSATGSIVSIPCEQ